MYICIDLNEIIFVNMSSTYNTNIYEKNQYGKAYSME